MPVAYEDASRLVTSGGTAQLALFSNVYRDPVRLDGVIKEPLPFREALAALHAIVGSDYRYVPKDRTAYLAYLRMQARVGRPGRAPGAADVLRLGAAQRSARLHRSSIRS